jgi:hypothetical protein
VEVTPTVAAAFTTMVVADSTIAVAAAGVAGRTKIIKRSTQILPFFKQINLHVFFSRVYVVSDLDS